MDGYGVAYWTTAASDFDPERRGASLMERMRPVVYKSTRPALNDLNLNSLVTGTCSMGVLAHIRAGTVSLTDDWTDPQGLTPVVETNNHPFLFGRYAFAHNGVLSQFSHLKIRLLSSLRVHAAREAILGTTDSEHMAALFFERLVGGTKAGWADLMAGKQYSMDDLAATMRGILGELEVWITECAVEDAQDRPDNAPANVAAMAQHSALNLVVCDGSTMVAIRYASPQPREPPSLYVSTTAGATMNRLYEGHPDKGNPEIGGHVHEGHKPRKEHGRHVIVASEPSTYDQNEWRLIPPQHMVVVGHDHIPAVMPI